MNQSLLGTRKSFGRKLMAGAMLVGLGFLGACGGKSTKPNESALGANQMNEGSAQVQTKQEVKKTVIRNTEIPTLVNRNVKADLNRMQAEHFVALGLPNDVAANTVKYRDDHGSFKNVDDLKQVPGMDQAQFDKIKDKVGIGSG